MPFTFSHPAIVLPFLKFSKKWFSATGLIIGSMVPDFEYFIRMKVFSIYSHTLLGIFWFDIPLAVLLYIIFYQIVCTPLVYNLPYFLRSRSNALLSFDWKNYMTTYWPAVLISMLIGTASHLLWDSFTHAHGYFVMRFSILTHSVTLFHHHFPLYKLLQHGSSLCGIIVIALTILTIQTTTPKNSNGHLYYWIEILFLTVIIVGIRCILGLSFTAYGNMVVTVIGAFLWSLIVVSAFERKRI
ncbi:DUF4184 family protein [Zhouia sp. PK063]|uniref:DUF4184 family protein n=1 Tax=Zhouia sp. PK063 TaxID=3373602 RepID=UPI0037AFC323